MLRLALISLLLLGACAPQPVVAPDGKRVIVTERAPECGADRFQNLIGLSEEDLLRIEILGPVRIVRPNTALTMDFRPERLNIALDDEGTVTRVYCG